MCPDHGRVIFIGPHTEPGHGLPAFSIDVTGVVDLKPNGILYMINCTTDLKGTANYWRGDSPVLYNNRGESYRRRMYPRLMCGSG